MPSPLKTAVVGPTGYAGFELTRLLLKHPRIAPPLLLSREGDGDPLQELASAYPEISGNGSHPLRPFSWEALAREGIELLFLATPHEVSRAWVPRAIQRGVRVIDLSGAWRLRNPNNRAVYGFADADSGIASELAESAIYGLPELHREDIASAQVVANPGCYATSIITALAPLLSREVVDVQRGIVCDSKSGVSGAGKRPTAQTHFVEVADNLSAYSVFGHRHTGEILEQLQLQDDQLWFSPHLLPIPRGILSTIYVHLKKAMTEKEIENIFGSFYANSSWVRIFGARLPQIRHSLHTNYCDVGFNVSGDGRRLVMVSCLDNLMKGAAGQAVQNMNVMWGWNEREGLN